MWPAPQVLLELVVRAASLNVSGHHLDVHAGLWRQGVEGTKIHASVERKKLWPRHHESSTSFGTAERAAAQAAAAHATMVLKEEEQLEEDGPAVSAGGEEEDTAYDTMDGKELEDKLGVELDVEERRKDPILKVGGGEVEEWVI